MAESGEGDKKSAVGEVGEEQGILELDALCGSSVRSRTSRTSGRTWLCKPE
jgi:hypothetical protein